MNKKSPQQTGWYLIYGIEESNLEYDEPEEREESYGYWIAQKFDNKWTSACGNNIVDVSYIKPLFNQPERSNHPNCAVNCEGDCTWMCSEHFNSSCKLEM